MNALAPVLILLFIAGVIGVLATATQMWAAGGGGDDLVGPRQARQRAAEPPATVPGTFRSLIHGEAVGWERADQWQVLTQRLDELELELGGTPSGTVPDRYSAEWLDQRLAQIEQVAGPLPAPLRPIRISTTSRRPWTRT